MLCFKGCDFSDFGEGELISPLFHDDVLTEQTNIQLILLSIFAKQTIFLTKIKPSPSLFQNFFSANL